MLNHVASWTRLSEPCAPPLVNNAPIKPGQVDRATQARFRPVGEPTTGGYSLRVRIISNTFVDVHQTVATKIVGFGDSPEVVDYSVLDQTNSAVSFDAGGTCRPAHRLVPVARVMNTQPT